MTHDQERQYSEQQHASYMSEQRNYGSKSDLSAILDAKFEREARERQEAEKQNDQRA